MMAKTRSASRLVQVRFLYVRIFSGSMFSAGGAENCARGGRAPVSIMVFGLNRVNRGNDSTINFHQLTGTVIFFPKRF
jgi:hypothetical protein